MSFFNTHNRSLSRSNLCAVGSALFLLKRELAALKVASPRLWETAGAMGHGSALERRALQPQKTTQVSKAAKLGIRRGLEEKLNITIF